MEEAERLCDRVAIIDHGRIVALDTPAELISNHGSGEILTFTVDRPLPAEFLDKMAQCGHIDLQGNTVVIHGDGSQAVQVSDVVLLLTSLGVQFRNLRSEGATLEDVFLKLTGREMKD
jgi:ABC-2 type transport system ATP-binding protein